MVKTVSTLITLVTLHVGVGVLNVQNGRKVTTTSKHNADFVYKLMGYCWTLWHLDFWARERGSKYSVECGRYQSNIPASIFLVASSSLASWDSTLGWSKTAVHSVVPHVLCAAYAWVDDWTVSRFWLLFLLMVSYERGRVGGVTVPLPSGNHALVQSSWGLRLFSPLFLE